jgi:general secretion pathway protein G
MNESTIKFARRSMAARGFTLIELLLVMMILAILAAVVVPKFTGRTQDAKISAAKADISNLKTALQMYELDCGGFPTSEQGLAALVEAPGGVEGWKKPYVDKVPTDPWGHAYIYRSPSTENIAGKDFDLLCCGPDGHEGGGDDIEP